MPNLLMKKIKFIYIFYKSTLLVNIAVSALLAIIGFAYFFQIFSISFMTAGPILGLLYKEVTEYNQYYFYYNKGISKVSLILSCFVISAVIGTVIFIVGWHA